MTVNLAEAVRNRLDAKTLPEAYIDATGALQAVLAKCEAMRADSKHFTATERGVAAEFERVIARALNIQTED